jgi:hypothetical protein
MAGHDNALLDFLLRDIRASDKGKNLGKGLDDGLASLQAECASLGDHRRIARACCPRGL